MPTVREIEQALFRLAPKEGAMDWDNVGQLLGDPEAEVRRVLVALDITEAVADEAIAENCQLIVSHHPVMNCKWLPVQTVRQDTPQGHLLLKILRSGLSAICMHTNLDVAPGGVNDALAAALGLEDPGPLGDPEGLCRMGTLASPMPLQEFAKHVCRALQANGVRYAGDSGPVRKVRRVRDLGPQLPPVFRRGREGHPPDRRGPLPHRESGVHRAGRVPARPVPGPHRHQIRLPPGGHPVLRRRRVMYHVRTFQMA